MTTARTFILGDVHGCLDELKTLVAKLDPKPNDRFVFVGDLVDKGPSPFETVEFVMGLCNTYKGSVCVMGNHEEACLRFFKNPAVKDPRGERSTLKAKMTPEVLAFMEAMPLSFHMPEHDARVVHGGVQPAFTERDFVTKDRLLSLPRDARHVPMTVLRVREVDARGQMVALGSERAGTDFRLLSRLEKDDIFAREGRPGLSALTKTLPTKNWAEIYDGRFGHVFYGHAPYLQDTPVKFPHATALDLGCVYGGWLCAAVLCEGAETKFVTVSAFQPYCEPRNLSAE